MWLGARGTTLKRLEKTKAYEQLLKITSSLTPPPKRSFCG